MDVTEGDLVPTKQCKTGIAAVQDGAEQNADGAIGTMVKASIMRERK